MKKNFGQNGGEIWDIIEIWTCPDLNPIENLWASLKKELARYDII